ncbi:hypothetical protein NKI34_27405 [Mesorhizobium sp. M0700]|uniref:hypothetical protein n=1 Tax=Mesorhizobium sp. M0700 TaxID=2956988 RepID=UPI00333BFC33
MHGQIGDQFPVDPWPMLWFLTLLGVQHREVERGIALLLPIGGRTWMRRYLISTATVSGLPLASRTSTSCSLLISSSFISATIVLLAVTRRAIDASPHQEMDAEFMGRAEKLVDVALAIADVDASRGIAEQRDRLAHILQPAEALLLDGHPHRIDLLFERGGSLELRPRPNLWRGWSEVQVEHGPAKTHSFLSCQPQRRLLTVLQAPS